MPDALDAFARRLRGDTGFLASALEDYAQSEGLDGQSLAARLGVEREDLGRLGLCRRPTGDTFARDIDTIARRFMVDERVLAEVVRRADMLRTLRAGEETAAAMAAARDRWPGGVAASMLPDMDAMAESPDAPDEDEEPE